MRSGLVVPAVIALCLNSCSRAEIEGPSPVLQEVDEAYTRICKINPAQFCRYDEPGLVGYPCSCGGKPGRFERLH